MRISMGVVLLRIVVVDDSFTQRTCRKASRSTLRNRPLMAHGVREVLLATVRDVVQAVVLTLLHAHGKFTGSRDALPRAG